MPLNEDKKGAPPSPADMQLALCSSPRLTREHTGASRREADEGPTQRMLSRPAGEKENGRPTKKRQ